MSRVRVGVRCRVPESSEKGPKRNVKPSPARPRGLRPAVPPLMRDSSNFQWDQEGVVLAPLVFVPGQVVRNRTCLGSARQLSQSRPEAHAGR